MFYRFYLPLSTSVCAQGVEALYPKTHRRAKPNNPGGLGMGMTQRQTCWMSVTRLDPTSCKHQIQPCSNSRKYKEKNYTPSTTLPPARLIPKDAQRPRKLGKHLLPLALRGTEDSNSTARTNPPHLVCLRPQLPIHHNLLIIPPE